MTAPLSPVSFVSDLQLPQLGTGAGFALWAFRACAQGHVRCCAVTRGFDAAFGTDGPETLAGMMRFVATVGHEGRRKVRLAMPGCLHVTTDEVSLTKLFAAAQDGNRLARDAHLSWVLGATPSEEVSALVTGIAESFASYGLYIMPPPLACDAPDMTRSSPGPLVLMDGGRA